MAIHSHTIIGKQQGPHLLILAGVHGDEYEPIAAVRALSRVINPDQLSGRVTLVPIVNEPAFRNVSRTGPDGLDLARTMPGREAGSVTEQIAWEAAALIRSADYLIDLHTGGVAMQISPLSGYMLHENEEIRAVQRQMARAFNLPIIWGTSARLEGRSLSVARDANIPAIYAEWGGGTGCPPEGVRDYVNGCLNVMRELRMWEQPLPENRLRLLVEDFREESGVFQINYPAPHAGFFEPAVALNDRVRPGDVLGWVHSLGIDVSRGNELTEHHSTRNVAGPFGPSPPAPLPGVPGRGECVSSTVITARQEGIVILLRVIPSVQPGDCLSTILECGEAGEFRHE